MWDEKGMLIAALSYKGPAITEDLEAEITAAVQAIKFAHEIGPRNIILERASLSVVERLLAHEEDSSWWGNLVQEAKMGLMQFRTWEVSHTRNEANNAAHILARHAQGIDNCEAWLEDVPYFLSKQLQCGVMQMNI